ncbi:Cell division cycle protein 23-like protein [Hypsibius exemplaris]|uniref:Cell division cycle protein 23-like protein n=1 Tax=Hypsibius exemplaris TaxID=2072580 RepID=A0A1W0WUG7_HYPEX|nr:Cell division cycle protein 23-like protein [Hypsibius exemplaris]
MEQRPPKPASLPRTPSKEPCKSSVSTPFLLEDIKLPLILRQTSYQDIKSDLTRCMIRSGRLCLVHSQRWAAELLRTMDKIKLNGDFNGGVLSEAEQVEAEMASSNPAYFCIHNAMRRYQYAEAVAYAQGEEGAFARLPAMRFFYFYARFLHGQSLWIQNCEAPLDFAAVTEDDVKYSMKLKEEIKQEHLLNSLDPLMRYLYGVILRQLGLHALAQDQLILAIAEEPFMWCYWFELADCVMSTKDLTDVLSRVRPHWMRDFFLDRAYSALNMTEEAYGTCKYLRKTLFSSTAYVMSQLAKVCYNRREFADAAKLMEKVRIAEPARLDDMDFYSTVLDVRGDKVRLAKLARDLHDIDPFAPETNVAIANYCRIRDQRDKTIEHLTMAIRACPDAPLPWLLLGHEYTELKNFVRATASYQKVVELNPRDYKAWYGLGQVCENDKKYPQAAVYFYRSAQNGRFDSRVWNALGDVYDKMEQAEDACRAYWQAYQVGDKDDGAIFKLGKIYERDEKKDKMVQAYERYIEVCEETLNSNSNGKGKDDPNRPGFAYSDVSHAYLVVADAYYNNQRYTEARALALKAALYSPTDTDVKSFCESILEPGDPGFDERSVLEKTFQSEYTCMEQSLDEPT